MITGFGITYSYKLQPTAEQVEIIEHNLNVCKSVWNYALYQRRLWYNCRSCKINMCCVSSEYIVEPGASPHGHAVGLDLGILSMLSTSDGLVIPRPKFLDPALRQIKLLQRKLRKKVLQSNKWKKLQHRLALLHETVANKRKDYHFKLAHQLCKEVGMIFVEDINFVSWSQGLFSKQSLDMGIGQFLTILEYVCSQTDTYFAKVDKNYTSQICPNCNTNTGKKQLSESVHHCHECGFEIDRDVAAAMVIRDRGLNYISVGTTVIKQPSNGVRYGDFGLVKSLYGNPSLLATGGSISIPDKYANQRQQFSLG